MKMDVPIGTQYGKCVTIGETFIARLTGGQRATYVVCRCECGRSVLRRVSTLREGAGVSCGMNPCVYRPNKTHGGSRKRLYAIWAQMKLRCGKYKSYEHVTLYEPWRDYANFHKWAMENGYREWPDKKSKRGVSGLTIDRINPNLGYCPENCRWITLEENSARVGGYWKERALIAEAEISRWQ